jgi:hypothetical protein
MRVVKSAPILALAALIALPLVSKPAYALRAARAQVMESLLDLARPRVRTLTREIHTYNYRGEPEGQAARYYSPEVGVGGYNATAARMFRDPSYRHPVKDFGTWYGNGFYTAVDPARTRAYSSPNFLDDWQTNYDHPWVLTRVAFPAGFKVLDVSSGDYLDQQTIVNLKEWLGCDFTNTVEPNLSVTRPQLHDLLVVTSESRHGCRAVMNDLLAELEIDAIAYTFSTSVYNRSACRNGAQRAFIQVGDLPRGSVRVFSSVLPPSGDSADAERIAIQAMFRRMTSVQPLWTGLPDLTDAQVDQYVSDHLFGCGGRAEERNF